MGSWTSLHVAIFWCWSPCPLTYVIWKCNSVNHVDQGTLIRLRVDHNSAHREPLDSGTMCQPTKATLPKDEFKLHQVNTFSVPGLKSLIWKSNDHQKHFEDVYGIFATVQPVRIWFLKDGSHFQATKCWKNSVIKVQLLLYDVFAKENLQICWVRTWRVSAGFRHTGEIHGHRSSIDTLWTREEEVWVSASLQVGWFQIMGGRVLIPRCSVIHCSHVSWTFLLRWWNPARRKRSVSHKIGSWGLVV